MLKLGLSEKVEDNSMFLIRLQIRRAIAGGESIAVIRCGVAVE
jgi:hypothetical protein